MSSNRQAYYKNNAKEQIGKEKRNEEVSSINLLTHTLFNFKVVSIRKDKREEAISKRRNINTQIE